MTKRPLELIAHLKGKEARNRDGSEMSDNQKRKAALEKAYEYRKQKHRDSRK